MNERVTVLIPIGPNPAYLKWLPEAISSVINQTYRPLGLLLINDGMPEKAFNHVLANVRSIPNSKIDFDYYENPCRLGVAAAFNVGVAKSSDNLVFMMGSDDALAPTCIEECVKEYNKQKIEGWYNVTIETTNNGIQNIPNHAAMITQELFEWFKEGNGYYGFPPSSGAGGPDALLLSILMVHAPEKIIQVQQGKPLYWVREHEHQMTKQDAAFFNPEVISIRNKETARFKPGKYK